MMSRVNRVERIIGVKIATVGGCRRRIVLNGRRDLESRCPEAEGKSAAPGKEIEHSRSSAGSKPRQLLLDDAVRHNPSDPH